MTSKSVAFLLADLGITKTHSRPHVSNDNPFSEAQFKTLKYRPDFPARFGSIQDVRAHCHIFFPWYNVAHHHSGLGLLTPHDVHFCLADQRVAARATTLATAYDIHPERFPRGLPQPPACPEAVWINAPKPQQPRRLAGSRQLAAVSLTTRDPGRYSRPTVPTLTDEAAWRLRHDVSPVPG
jgi:putative transposase